MCCYDFRSCFHGFCVVASVVVVVVVVVGGGCPYHYRGLFLFFVFMSLYLLFSLLLSLCQSILEHLVMEVGLSCLCFMLIFLLLSVDVVMTPKRL